MKRRTQERHATNLQPRPLSKTVEFPLDLRRKLACWRHDHCTEPLSSRPLEPCDDWHRECQGLARTYGQAATVDKELSAQAHSTQLAQVLESGKGEHTQQWTEHSDVVGVPVGATPITSRPDIIVGIACACGHDKRRCARESIKREVSPHVTGNRAPRTWQYEDRVDYAFRDAWHEPSIRSALRKSLHV